MNDLKNIKILYIEDEDMIRQNAVEYLSFSSDFVYQSDNGEDGYNIYKECKPDIIICDIMMPKMNGLELIQKIRKDDKKTQIIIATARIDTDFLLKAVELRLVKYLTKPITEAKLMPVLHEAISLLETKESNIVELNDNIKYDTLNQTLFKDKKMIKLTKKETLFIDICAKNSHRSITYSELKNYVWEGYMTDSALRSVVKDLRKKLPKDALQNISGIGYKLQVKI